MLYSDSESDFGLLFLIFPEQILRNALSYDRFQASLMRLMTIQIVCQGPTGSELARSPHEDLDHRNHLSIEWSYAAAAPSIVIVLLP